MKVASLGVNSANYISAQRAKKNNNVAFQGLSKDDKLILSLGGLAISGLAALGISKLFGKEEKQTPEEYEHSFSSMDLSKVTAGDLEALLSGEDMITLTQPSEESNIELPKVDNLEDGVYKFLYHANGIYNGRISIVDVKDGDVVKMVTFRNNNRIVTMEKEYPKSSDTCLYNKMQAMLKANDVESISENDISYSRGRYGYYVTVGGVLADGKYKYNNEYGTIINKYLDGQKIWDMRFSNDKSDDTLYIYPKDSNAHIIITFNSDGSIKDTERRRVINR